MFDTTEQSLWDFSRVASSGKSKHILWNKLIKYNSLSGKSKKIG